MTLAEGGWESTWPVSCPWGASVYPTRSPECCSSLEPPAPFLLAASSAASLGETPAAGPALLGSLGQSGHLCQELSKGSLFWKTPSNFMNCKVSGRDRVEKHLSQSLQCQKLCASQ